MSQLPHETRDLFLTDGGIETSLIFLDNFELPSFAAFDLLKNQPGIEGLKNYYRRYLNLAREFKTRFILESPTWRASQDWIKKLGYAPAEVDKINSKAVHLMKELKKEYKDVSILISGCVGPRGDGYKVEKRMTALEAQHYHSPQIKAFKSAGADMVSAITMNYVEEAIGIARAGRLSGIPTLISFTVETNGQLPSGASLREAIEMVDKEGPAYFMINCAHPSHFVDKLRKAMGQPWTERILGIRANASCKSHAELDEAPDLDRGDPMQLAYEHVELKTLLPNLRVFGGCCGTDEDHIRQIAMSVGLTTKTLENGG